VAWQLRTRTGSKVYAWIPPEAFDPKTTYLSGDLYEDLAKYASIDGLIFYHGELSDYEHELAERARLYRPQLKIAHQQAGLSPMILEKN